MVSRLTSQYQLSKALFARVLVQYGLEDRDALQDPVADGLFAKLSYLFRI